MVARGPGLGVSDGDGEPSHERLRVLRLVKELQALSDGTDSPAESASAAAKAQSLLLKHNLSVADVAQLEGQHGSEDPLVEKKTAFAAGRRKVEGWRQMLVQVVAASCLCEWMTSFYREPGARTYSFIGRRSNVEVAAYSYRCLERQVLHPAISRSTGASLQGKVCAGIWPTSTKASSRRSGCGSRRSGRPSKRREVTAGLSCRPAAVKRTNTAHGSTRT